MRYIFLASFAIFAVWNAPTIWGTVSAIPGHRTEAAVREAWERDPARGEELARTASLACLGKRFGMPSPFITSLHADTNAAVVRGIVERRPEDAAGDVEQRITEALREVGGMAKAELDAFTRYASLIEKEATPLLECTMDDLRDRLSRDA